MNLILKLFSFKLITSLLGLLYSILQVRYFGASRTIEIYFAAQSLIYLVISMTQSGQLAEIFLPEFHKLNLIKKGLGFTALNIVVNRMLIWGSVIALIVLLFTPFFINLLVPGFSINEKEQAALMFRILLPCLFLQLTKSFFITVLNAEKKFGRAEFLAITNTLVNIISLVVFYDHLGIWSLVISLLLGKIIEFIFYINQLYKIGFRHRFIIYTHEFNHSLFFKTMRNTTFYVGATQIYSIILTAGTSFLPEGTYAIFKYVQNLTKKIKGLFVQPFLTVFFTKYSILIQEFKSAASEFKKNMASIINMNVIIIIGSILLGDLIIELMWGGNNFNNENVRLAYLFLLTNLGAVLILSIGAIYRKMAVAQGKGKILYLFWVIAQLLSAVFTYFLLNYLKIKGLFFIIPINSMLLGLTSYVIYKKTKNSISYNFLNKESLINFGLIAMAVLIKYISLRFYKEVFTVSLTIYTIVLSLFPLHNTMNELKDNH